MNFGLALSRQRSAFSRDKLLYSRAFILNLKVEDWSYNLKYDILADSRWPISGRYVHSHSHFRLVALLNIRINRAVR